MKNTLTLIYGISLALLLSGPAWGADGERSGQLPNPDKKFVENAVNGGQMEVQLGQMASERGANPMVRDFGTRMVQDHQKANDELNRILTQKGITEPASLTKTTKMTGRFQNLNGADFDRAYIKDMVKDHKEDVASFKNEAANGKDPDLRSWAAQTLPTLEDHLQSAQKTESSITSSN